MTDLNIDMTATMKVSGDLTVSAFAEFAKTVPGDAKLRIEVKPPSTQMDSTVTTVTATWKGKLGKQSLHTPIYPPGTR